MGTRAQRETNPNATPNEPETQPEIEPLELDEARTVEYLHGIASQSPGSFRDKAQVFRCIDDKVNKQGSWVADVDVKELLDARHVVSRACGRGLYQVVLMDSVTGKRAKVAYLKIEVDYRALPEANAPPKQAPHEALAIDALREALRSRDSRIDSLERALTSSSGDRGRGSDVYDKLLDKLDDARDRASTKYQEGYAAGLALGLTQGRLEGELETRKKIREDKESKEEKSDASWGPEDVSVVIREVGNILNKPGAPSKSSAKDTGAQVQIIDIFKQALETGMTAVQTVQMVRMLRGDDVIRAIASAGDRLVQEALRHPEIQQLMQRYDVAAWLSELQGVLGSIVGSPDGAADTGE